MKKVGIILSLLAGSTSLFAQDGIVESNTSGIVQYEQVIKLDIQLEGEAAQFAHALPKERRSNKILHFTPKASLYENFHTEDSEEVMDMAGGANVMIKMAEPDNKMFTDLEKGVRVEQREFMSRMFLIESELQKNGWKMTGNQKMILDFPCQEAVTQREDKEVHAWFTPAIPVSAGPAGYSGLPGLVLAVEMDGGDQTITASSVEPGVVDKDVLKKPGKGKKVTEDEFQAIVEEKMEEMGVEREGGSGHAVVVRIRQ